MHLQSKGQMPGVTKMAQLVKALVPKPDDLRLILRPHVVAKPDSFDLHTSAIDMHAEFCLIVSHCVCSCALVCNACPDGIHRIFVCACVCVYACPSPVIHTPLPSRL